MLSIVVAVLIAQQPVVASPARQQEIMAAIKAEREKAPAPAVKPLPSVYSTMPVVSPSDRVARKKAGYRAFQQRQAAEDAARQAAAKREALMMLPYQIAAQRDMLQYQSEVYAADRRLEGTRALANGLKGVTAPPYY